MKRLAGFLLVLASVFALLVGCLVLTQVPSSDSTEKNDKTLDNWD